MPSLWNKKPTKIYSVHTVNTVGYKKSIFLYLVQDENGLVGVKYSTKKSKLSDKVEIYE
jgi:hypothetical protein